MILEASEVQSLELDECIVIDIFCIARKCDIMDVIGVSTKMHSMDTYQIIDAFGYIVYEGDAETIAAFATGLTDGR